MTIDIGRYTALAERLDGLLLGQELVWEIPKGTACTRREMADHLQRAAIPIVAMGKPPTDRSRVTRSINSIEVELRRLEQGNVFDLVEETFGEKGSGDAGRAVWDWMTRKVISVPSPGGGYTETYVEVPRRFVYDKNTRTVRAESELLNKLESQIREFRSTGQVLDINGNSIPFDVVHAGREIGRLRQELAETQQMLLDLLAKFSDLMTTEDIRRVFTYIVDRRANGISRRKRGGVYIIPRPMVDWVDKLKSLATALGNGCRVNPLPIVDMEKLVAVLEDMAQTISDITGGSVPADLTDILTAAKQQLETRDSVESLFDAFEANFVNKIRERKDTLAKLRKEGRATREHTLGGELEELSELTGKVNMFAQLLQLNARDYLRTIKEVEDEVVAYSREVAVRKTAGRG